MRNLYLVLLMILGASNASYSQLANGSTGPDFTLTDRDGVEHNLYSYLDQGKAVFIKFFACHCPSCWSYHNTGKLETLFQTYGPDGTDDIMVLMLEHDVNNPEAFTGGGTYTQGDWTAGNSIPMIDVEGNDRDVFDDWNLNWYPLVMKVCPDRTVEMMSTSLSVQQLWDEANDCEGNLSIHNIDDAGTIYYNTINKQLNYLGFDQVTNVSIYNLAGQKSLDVSGDSNGIIDLSIFTEGMYVIQIHHAQGMTSKKIMVQ